MKQAFLFLSCTFFTILVSAQKKTAPVTVEDLQLKSCSFEPEANAMKIYDVQETEIETSYTNRYQKTTRKVRIKIFNEKGFKHAEVNIPYLSKRGMAKIKRLDGAIYNLEPDGKINVKKLDKDDFFKEKAAQYVGTVSFTFPGLKAGSIIEYNYTTVETDLIYFPPWLIQAEIPVLYASKAFDAPIDFKIFEQVVGADSVSKESELLRKNKYRLVTYSIENIPSFKFEPFMSSTADHLVRVNFHVLPFGGMFSFNEKGSSDAVWKNAGYDLIYSTVFREEVEKTIPGTEKIIDSAKNMSSTEDRIRYLYNRVKDILPEKVEQTRKADSLAEAWSNKSGTSAEINLILLNLLNHSGVESIPLFISTRSHGKINKDFPSLGQLNGIDVLAIDSNKFFVLDASLKYQSYKNPPLNILNREAYLVSPDNMQWVTITDDRPLLKINTIILSDLTNDGKIEGSGTIQYYDYAKAYKLDTSLNNGSSKEDEKYLNKNELDVKILSVKKENTGTSDEPLLESVEFIYEPQITDDFIYISPQVLNGKIKNPFVSEKRNTDVDMGCNQVQMLNFQLHFPPGFTVEHLPKNIKMRAPDSSFLFVVTYSADAENIYVLQTLESKRAIFSKEEYPGLQDFFKRMYALMSEEIILKKKK